MALSLIVFFLMGVSCVNAGKILLIPGPATSHCLEMISIGEELLKRGHHVTLYSMLMDEKRCLEKINTELYKPRFKVAAPNIDPSLIESEKEMLATLSTFFFERKSLLEVMSKFLVSMMKSNCDASFQDMKLLEDLRKEKYDLALVEGVPFMGCFFAVPIFLDVPVAAVGSFIDAEDSKMPMQTNIFPSFLTEYSNDMSFIQRVINTLLFFVNPLMRKLIIPAVDLSQYSEKLAGYDSRDLIKNSILFIENSDYIVDYPKALFPNFVQAGALTANPAKPLPTELKKMMDSAKDGTVLVTFGSMLRDLPAELKEKMMTVFGQLKHQVIFKQDKDEVRGNVKVLKWVPQNDILGHPNTKLFISHCGKNGFWEGVYHGVPIICMAVHAETYTTKVKVKKYGIGSSINIFDDSVDELVATINGVLQSESIHRNMKKISTLLRDRPETARQRAASAIEHVIKYGGDHMKPPSVEFGFLSYTNVDVLFTMFLIDVMIIVFSIWLVRKCCCRSKASKSKTD